MKFSTLFANDIKVLLVLLGVFLIFVLRFIGLKYTDLSSETISLLIFVFVLLFSFILVFFCFYVLGKIQKQENTNYVLAVFIVLYLLRIIRACFDIQNLDLEELNMWVIFLLVITPLLVVLSYLLVPWLLNRKEFQYFFFKFLTLEEFFFRCYPWSLFPVAISSFIIVLTFKYFHGDIVHFLLLLSFLNFYSNVKLQVLRYDFLLEYLSSEKKPVFDSQNPTWEDLITIINFVSMKVYNSPVTNKLELRRKISFPFTAQRYFSGSPNEKVAEMVFKTAMGLAATVFAGWGTTITTEIFESDRQTRAFNREHTLFCIGKVAELDTNLREVRRQVRELYDQINRATLASQFSSALERRNCVMKLFKEDPKSYDLAATRADFMFQKCAYILCSSHHTNNPNLFYIKWRESPYRDLAITFLHNNPISVQDEDLLLKEVILRVMKRFVGDDDSFSVIQLPKTDFNSEGKIEELN